MDSREVRPKKPPVMPGAAGSLKALSFFRFALLGAACCLLVSLGGAQANTATEDPFSTSSLELPENLPPLLARVIKALGLPPVRAYSHQEVPCIELQDRALERLFAAHPRAMVSARETVLKKLGLLPAAFDLREQLITAQVRQVMAMYVPTEERLEVCQGLPREDLEEALTHEYVHMIQDQRFQLRSRTGLGEEEARALRALAEGQAARVTATLSGVSRQSLRSPRASRLPDPTPDVSALLSRDAAILFPGARLRAAGPLVAAGMAFLEAFEQRFGPGSGAFFSPPVSTEQLLHFDRYLAHERPATVTMDDLPRLLGLQWKPLDSMVLGELNVALWLGEEPGGPFSAGWAGDRMMGFRGSNGQILVCWRTAWDTEADALEFLSVARGRLRYRFPQAGLVRQLPNGFIVGMDQEGYGVLRLGTEVRMVFGAPSGTAEQLLEAGW